MAHTGFYVLAGSFNQVSYLCAHEGLDGLVKATPSGNIMHFPKQYAASQIMQLGTAVTSLTGVPQDFGNETGRSEPEACLFVDRLDRKWVAALSALSNDKVNEIQQLWVLECIKEEGERPSWGHSDKSDLINIFVRLCQKATEAEEDLLMVWVL